MDTSNRVSNPIQLEIFKHLFASIAEEMGVVLRRSSYSPNIKERQDFSCALFDNSGRMVAQAAHIPVHLGSMPMSVASAIKKIDEQGGIQTGDAIILNDPYAGGTHLPDITLVSPVFAQDKLIGFVASRAHHADVGGMAPGSMPIANEIFQEGLIIPPVKLIDRGNINRDILDLILANVRTPDERRGDLLAQVAANQRGCTRLAEMATKYGEDEIAFYMDALIQYTERMTRRLLMQLPNGEYKFADYMDDNGVNDDPVLIQVKITIEDDLAEVDFTGSSPQQNGSINAVRAITHSAIFYVFRSLIGLDVPNNAGCIIPINIITPIRSVVDAQKPSPVAGGNVETSQRIVDVLLGAMAQAAPNLVPAASQGTMNNITVGGWDHRHQRPFAYYETIAGGMGARPGLDGMSAVHTHMTNTLNTPIEALEYAYPLRVRQYAVKRHSGGDGQYRGGDGMIREIETLVDAKVTLLSERRRIPPYGLSGGEPGTCGENVLIQEGREIQLEGKCSFSMKAGDVLRLSTPGGGGWGVKKDHLEAV